MEENIKKFIDSCDELISCKYLVAEYKIQTLLKALANAEEICELVGDCLEQFNRDREFAKAYIQDGHGDFTFVLPEEEYKVIALVFCTLVDIDNKKIDFTDFVKRFFGNNENPFGSFIESMIVPFRHLIAEAFGYENVQEEEMAVSEEDEEEKVDIEEKKYSYFDKPDDAEEDEDDEEEDDFVRAQKLAVQILSQLEFAKQDDCVKTAMQICRAVVKTTELADEDVAESLAFALKSCKVKPAKYLIKELIDVLD